MKREELTAIFPEATKEQIDKIMNINGSDVEHARRELEDTKKKLSEANDSIEQLKVDAEELKRLQDVETELTDLKNANVIREMREKVSKETGVPVHLLTGDTEEDCTAWANSMKEYARPQAYPKVPNGGEGTKSGASPTTAEQFAKWTEEIF